MRGRIQVYFKSNNSLVVTINIRSQVEKQIVNSELKDIETGPGGRQNQKNPHKPPTHSSKKQSCLPQTFTKQIYQPAEQSKPSAFSP